MPWLRLSVKCSWTREVSIFLYKYQFFDKALIRTLRYIPSNLCNLIRTLVGNKIVDRRCFDYTFIVDIIDLTPGFNGLVKDNCKARRETFRFYDLVRLILELWLYLLND